jgi:hypothetical protein
MWGNVLCQLFALTIDNLPHRSNFLLCQLFALTIDNLPHRSNVRKEGAGVGFIRRLRNVRSNGWGPGGWKVSSPRGILSTRHYETYIPVTILLLNSSSASSPTSLIRYPAA